MSDLSMDQIKMKVCVEVTVLEDSRFMFNILANESLDDQLIRSILSGGLALSIRGEETPKEQAGVLRDVIEYLESEFINVDSFSDIKTRKDLDSPN
jgi:hypothetical protein